MARPSSYRPEYAEQTEKLCKLGATDAELADFFGITEKTVNAWKNLHEGFSESLKKGKRIADANVAERLYQRAMGYSHEAVKIMTVPVGGNAGSEVVHEAYIEHYPPDTTACIFWLKNRQPAKWRDRHEHTGANGGPIQTETAIVDHRSNLNALLEEHRPTPKPESGDRVVH